MQSLSGLGISSSTTAPFAVTTSWTSASNARPTKPPPPARNAQSPGASATYVPRQGFCGSY
ncbi:putative ubiquitin ligase subunit protein [Alternaria alternata]|nr:putative ubiquitin ligase subunit protein [Alternaria alternata]